MQTLNNKYLLLALIGMIAFLLSGCEEHYIPKPRGYFRIELPEKKFEVYQTRCPLATEVPVYSKIEVVNTGEDSCWFNVVMPRYNARLYCTYVPVQSDIDKLFDDAYKFAFKHESKADAIQRSTFQNDSTRVYGMVYDLKGDVASPIQFFATDSTDHFLRGSLYFNHEPNADSLQPVIEYLREDILHMMETIQWN